ncbi:metabolite traffic protein EboE [Aporhodopirellula aestuarii]|uniref:Metabolite traffic protein EboE n=1 Tax=Aporhodopirellula aestuarii TaxID=2950107 RepID=A0ABT0U6D8_9BACT|nr:metabolite traffic protein EboE [Aporhodopirellula aestuarii]MCM2372234.1 metabolite traffic protein EboE [Aporhodopirellula aestuarii]
MPSAPRSHWTLGYCTNIHPGIEVDAICDNLKSVSAEVARRRAKSTGPLGIGLWIPSVASVALRRHGMPPLENAIKKNKLLAYTINGFPFDDFHGDRVKHAVYQPTWWQDERVVYTRDLAKILGELLPEDVTTGTISTLPLGWPRQIDELESTETETIWRDVSEDELLHAGTNLRRLAEDLRMLENRTGKRIIVAIEPEPGCLLQRSEEIVKWFKKELPDPTHRRYIGVCHDVCHSAVMMEDQRETLQRYADAGIVLGKVQISSAIVADWKNIEPSDHQAVLDQLRGFAEDRYLHQTGRLTANGKFELSQDLPELLDSVSSTPITDQRWLIHFHVPVFLEKFGQLTTTRDQINEALDAVEQLATPLPKGSRSNRAVLEFTGHLEVETYAWSVLPNSERTGALAIDDSMSRNEAMARDIAYEIDYVDGLLK